jgi:hypothetical protein
VEAVRFGWLFPQQPYTVQVNTFHVPSVESTLLRIFSKGTNFVHAAAPLVFCDTLQLTVSHMQTQGYIDMQGQPLRLYMGSTLQTLSWTLPDNCMVWKPQLGPAVLASPAAHYRMLIALYWRVNGASHLFSTLKSKDDNLREKVREFIDRHVEMAMRVDAMTNPSDAELCDKPWAVVASGGPTDWLDDRDAVQKTTRILAMELTPFEVLNIEGDTRSMLGHLAAQIKNNSNDDVLEAQFTGMVPPRL